MYFGWQKGTSWEEAMSSSEEIKPAAISIVELRLAKNISQLVENSVNKEIYFAVEDLGLIIFGLGYTNQFCQTVVGNERLVLWHCWAKNPKPLISIMQLLPYCTICHNVLV